MVVSHPSHNFCHHIIPYYIIITSPSTHHAGEEARGEVGGEEQCVGELQEDVEQEGRLREKGGSSQTKPGSTSVTYPQRGQNEKELPSRDESKAVHYQQGQHLAVVGGRFT